MGTYVDANAVSPATTRAIGAIVERAGAVFVDGGIVGPPPRTSGTTRLYLSGPAAERVAALFSGSVLETIVLDGPIAAASALKVAYAGWTKGSAALLMTMRALAIAEGVDDALLREWERSIPGLAARSESAVRDNFRKAWRFVDEMREIAETLVAAGLPDGFHRAAANVYERLAPYKDTPTQPSAADAARVLKQ
jgi:3-hydroxyisobutyrate dehydrogenase-like beta-hydroxyacid dehydrogenase